MPAGERRKSSWPFLDKSDTTLIFTSHLQRLFAFPVSRGTPIFGRICRRMPLGVQGFVKGRAKTGGRKIGYSDKVDRIRRSVAEKLAEHNFDPILELIKIAVETEDQPLRARVSIELAKYVHPQLKVIEMIGNPLVEVNVSGIELLQSRIDRIVERQRESRAICEPARDSSSSGTV
jgi:hypothetical protein